MLQPTPTPNAHLDILQDHQETPHIILIDGRSGSGKTTLAAGLASELGAATLHLEHLYPGWDGLAAGSQRVVEVLETGSYSRFDWFTGEFEEQRSLNFTAPLIIEGCGAITQANLEAAHSAAKRYGTSNVVQSVWIDCPEPVRRQRALARDGEIFAPHWNLWALQEETHMASERPRMLADTIYAA